MQTFKAILSGWNNYLSKSEVSEAKAKYRAMWCIDCPSLKHGKLLAMIKDDLKEIEGHYCDECKCPISAKIRSNFESCPKDLW